MNKLFCIWGLFTKRIASLTGKTSLNPRENVSGFLVTVSGRKNNQNN